MIRRMIARVLRLSGRYKGRIQGAFVFSVFNVIFSKMPICYAMITVYWLCLLYTSPSPRDRQKSRMPSSA